MVSNMRKPTNLLEITFPSLYTVRRLEIIRSPPQKLYTTSRPGELLYPRGKIEREEDSSILSCSGGCTTPAYLRRGDEREGEGLRRNCFLSRKVSIGSIPIPTSKGREKLFARNVAHGPEHLEVVCRVVVQWIVTSGRSLIPV